MSIMMGVLIGMCGTRATRMISRGTLMAPAYKKVIRAPS